MKLLTLTTQNFRNLADAETLLHPEANLLVGRNGQGKTNVLEAIYFLATTRSFRTSKITSLFRFETQNVFVSGVVRRDGLDRTLSVGLEIVEGNRRRVLMLNGEKVPLSAYLGETSIFAYSADRLDAIRGTPEQRRRFLDRGVASVNPAYLEQLTRYGRVLKQRNALLGEIRHHHASAASLDAWDNELMVAAAAVHRARGAYAAELQAAFRRIVASYRYHVSDLELRYVPNATADLTRLRKQELRAGMTLTGPQRDQVDFFVGGRPAAEVLSGGEQKMIVLFLKFAKIELAHRRTEDPPLLLLDDIDAELDLEILQELLLNLPRATQVFATSAKEAFLAGLQTRPHRRVSVENGRVVQAQDFP